MEEEEGGTLRRRRGWRGRSESRKGRGKTTNRAGRNGEGERGKMACGTPSFQGTRSEKRRAPHFIAAASSLFIADTTLRHISLRIPRGIPRYVRRQRENESRARKSDREREKERVVAIGSWERTVRGGNGWFLENASSIPG